MRSVAVSLACVMLAAIVVVSAEAQDGWQPGDPLPPAVIFQAAGHVETFSDYRTGTGVRTDRSDIDAHSPDPSLDHDIFVEDTYTATGNIWGTGEATRDLSARLLVTTTSDTWTGSISRTVNGDASAISSFDRSPDAPGPQVTGIPISGKAGFEHVVGMWHRWKPVGWNPGPYIAIEISGDLTTTSTDDAWSSPGADVKGQYASGSGTPDRSFIESIATSGNTPYAFEYMGWLYRSFDDPQGQSPWARTAGSVVAYAYAGNGTVSAEATVSQQFNITIDRLGQESPVSQIDASSGGVSLDGQVTVGNTVLFDGSMSQDQDPYPSDDNGILAYRWSVETPSGTITSEQSSVSVLYDVEGEYQIELTVIDDEFVSSTRTETLTVGNGVPPVANVLVLGEQILGNELIFNGLSSNDDDDLGDSVNGIASYRWYKANGDEFDLVGTQAEQPFQQLLLENATFKLVVTDDEGETDTEFFFISTTGDVEFLFVDDSDLGTPSAPRIYWSSGDATFSSYSLHINDTEVAAGMSGNSYQLENLYSVLDAELTADIEVRGHDAIGVYEDDTAYVDLGPRRVFNGRKRIQVLGITIWDLIGMNGALGIGISAVLERMERFLESAIGAYARLLSWVGAFSSAQSAASWINDQLAGQSAHVDMGVPNRTITWSIPGAEYDKRIVGAVRIGVYDEFGNLVPSVALDNLSLSVGSFVGPAPTPYRPFTSSDMPNALLYLSTVNGFGKSGETWFNTEFSIPDNRIAPLDNEPKYRFVRVRL